VKVIATVGETAVLALPAPGFEALTREQRLFAYWLAQAGNAGDAIAWEQGSRHSLAVARLLRGILTHTQAVPPEVLPRLRDYARVLYLQHGLYDDATERKAAPAFRASELRTAALAARAAGADFGLKPGTSLEAFLRELEGPLFDPSLELVRTSKIPPGGADPLLASAVNLYEGVNMNELAHYRDQYPLNSRLVKENGKVVEQVYRAGQPAQRGQGRGRGEPAVPAGLAAERLARVVAALEQAMRFASGSQLQGLRELAAYFRSGDAERFRSAQREWVRESAPVDFILGFIDTHADPRAQKGMFEGFVGIEDAQRTQAVQRLASHAQELEDAEPWLAEYKRQAMLVAAASAMWVAGGSGENRPQSFVGVTLPNDVAESERFGSKSILLPGLDEALSQACSLRIARELAPPALEGELARCRSQQRFAQIALHEIVGHASGRASQRLAEAHLVPKDLLREHYWTLEEARADLVAHWNATGPRARELGLIPDATCQALYPQAATDEWLASLARVEKGDRVEEDHLRADQLMIWWFTEKGAVGEHSISGKRYLVVLDAAKWRAAAGELLALLQDLKARGDYTQLKALLEAHASRLNPVWRDDVIARLRAAGIPRRAVALAPVLRPVLVDGKVVDATAEPVRDLDAQLLTDWAAF
jgi:dipeptidyl-peptidase-3